MEILRLMGFAVCHQAPARTLTASGETLPLCARCSGIYLGALCAVIYLIVRGRLRASTFPRGWTLASLLLPAALTAADVVLFVFRTADPAGNTRRLFLGSALGCSAALLLAPACAGLFAARRTSVPSVASVAEAALVVVFAVGVPAALTLQGGALALLAGAASAIVRVAALVLVNLAILTALSRPGASRRRMTGVAAAFALGEIGLAGAARVLVFSAL